MANVQSAEKRNRQRIGRRARNLLHLSRLRSSVKKVLASVESKDAIAKAPVLLKEAVRLIDKAAQKGVIKRETASRKIARLTKHVAAQATK